MKGQFASTRRIEYELVRLGTQPQLLSLFTLFCTSQINYAREQHGLLWSILNKDYRQTRFHFKKVWPTIDVSSNYQRHCKPRLSMTGQAAEQFNMRGFLLKNYNLKKNIDITNRTFYIWDSQGRDHGGGSNSFCFVRACFLFLSFFFITRQVRTYVR